MLLTDNQPAAVATTQSKPERSPALAPLIGFALVLSLAAMLNPPERPAFDAGPIETWVTFVLAEALIFGLVFGTFSLLFWAVARLATRRPSPIARYFGAAAVITTMLLLLGGAGAWYGRHIERGDPQGVASKE